MLFPLNYILATVFIISKHDNDKMFGRKAGNVERQKIDQETEGNQC